MKIPGNLRWKPTGRSLGQGGQGAVVEVEDSANEFDGKFALKALSGGKPKKAYERFAREIKAINAISHPSIVNIVDHSSTDADFHYYVMDCCEGALSLKKLLGADDNPFKGNARNALSLFISLVSAIQACGAEEIVHRDLSPGNVLVLPDRSVRIIDFGICQVSDGETITLTDEGVGTQNYMAPETEAGASGEISSKADLYSAGKILWSAIANQNAFAREEPVFNAKSMHTLFPEDPTTWHLHHIFEGTIRQEHSNRWTVDDALAQARHVNFLVTTGHPPLELIDERCPLCGVGKLGKFDGAHMVFGNPNPSSISSLQCRYCGFCFAQNRTMVRENLQRRTELR